MFGRIIIFTMFTNTSKLCQMERNSATLVPSLPLEAMEHFFKSYTTVEAQSLLWRWFVLSIRNEFRELSTDEMQRFADFFDQLQNLVIAAHAIQQSERHAEHLEMKA